MKVGNHQRVYEYDGAFKCYACGQSWGAVPGNPPMPEKCEREERRKKDRRAKEQPGEVDALGEQPTHFEMARTRMLRKRIADIVATHDAFVAKATKERAEALRHAIDKARGIGLTKAEQEEQEDYDCPHAYPHRYCQTCKVDPCPIGLGRTPPPPERP